MNSLPHRRLPTCIGDRAGNDTLSATARSPESEVSQRVAAGVFADACQVQRIAMQAIPGLARPGVFRRLLVYPFGWVMA